MTLPTNSPQQYIEDRIERLPFSGCWIWMRAVTSRGYGSLVYRNRPYLAHRFSFSIFNDGLDEFPYVCHACDTPLCVNPDHLFLGTGTDNLNDAYRKGRRPKTGPSKGFKNAERAPL